MILKILKWIAYTYMWTIMIGGLIMVATTSNTEKGGCVPNPHEQTETEDYIQYLENRIEQQEEKAEADKEDLIRQIEWQYGIKILDEEPSNEDKVASEVAPGFYWDTSVPNGNNAQK